MSLNQHDRFELSDLASSAADGTITSEQNARLESLLEFSPDARAYYVRFMAVSAGLAWSARDALEPVPQLVKQTSRFSPWRHWAIPLSAAAVLAVAIIGMWAALRPNAAVTPVSRPAGIATLSTAVNVEWANAREPDHVGNLLKPGWVHLKSGIAQIDFVSGASVWLEGPVDVRLDSGHEAFCASGKIVADVPAGARELQINAPCMSLLKTGTACGINVSNSSCAAVHVFRGLVEVSAHDSHATTPVAEGQAYSFDQTGSTKLTAADPSVFSREEFNPFGPGAGPGGAGGAGGAGEMGVGRMPAGFGMGAAEVGGAGGGEGMQWAYPYVGGWPQNAFPFDPGHRFAPMPPMFGAQWKGSDPLDGLREQLSCDPARWLQIRKPLLDFLDAQGEAWGWGSPDKPVPQAALALWATLQDHDASDDQIANHLHSLRDARNQARHKLEVSQSTLRNILTPTEESRLVSLGYIP